MPVINNSSTGKVALAIPILLIGIWARTYAQAPVGDLPWHLVNTYLDLPEISNVHSLSIDVMFLDDVPESANLFVAAISGRCVNKQQFYFGCWTHMDGLDQKLHVHHDLGPGLVFSKWGDRSRDLIRLSQGGYFVASGHEGDHVSTRAKYKWAKGKYTFTLNRLNSTKTDDENFVWIGAFVYSYAANDEFYVGAIRFPGNQLTFSGQVGSFVELYDANPKARPNRIPNFRVAIGGLSIDGVLVKPKSVIAVYPEDVPDHAVASRIDLADAKQLALPGPNPLKPFQFYSCPHGEGARLITISEKKIPRSKRVEVLYNSQR